MYKIVEISALSDSVKKTMLSLMKENYDNVDPKKFYEDLHKKDGIIALSYQDKLCGFSSYKLLETVFQGKICYAIFSGDTTVKRTQWGQSALFKAFIYLMKYFLNKKKTPIYWFLLSKGFRTYQILPLYFKKYYPSVLFETPDYEKGLLDQLALSVFGNFYYPKETLVRLQPPADRLKNDLASVPDHKKKNMHVKFFLDINPEYYKGDELTCLTKVDSDNFTRLTMKYLRDINNE